MTDPRPAIPGLTPINDITGHDPPGTGSRRHIPRLPPLLHPPCLVPKIDPAQQALTADMIMTLNKEDGNPVSRDYAMDQASGCLRRFPHVRSAAAGHIAGSVTMLAFRVAVLDAILAY